MSKNLSQVTKDQIKDLIVKTVKQEKPETAKQLIALMQQNHAITPEETSNLLIELENENRLRFTRHELSKPSSAREYIFSKQATWYWTTILLATVITIAVFTITGDSVPLVFFRYSLGIIFVLFLPGFTLVKVLFPAKIPLKTSLESTDMIERVALSFGMSLALVPIVGLILNFTPWGIKLTTIILSLIALTVVFATASILREHHTKLGPAQTKR
ncbi:MAG: DUF1616 domain-containing protein [Candidatus Bathyarchaeia archaeon]